MNISDGVREILRLQGWSLRRRADAGRLRFVVRRGASGAEVCEFTLEAPRGDGRSLMPATRLKARPRPGARLDAGRRKALRDLQAALGGFLESLRPGPAAPAQGTALAEKHEGNEGSDLLLRTTFACNQKCAFCFVPLTGRPADLAHIERELDAQSRRSGPRGELTISGGEPTSDPRLLSILASARRRGFRRFVLQTNGVYLAQPPLLESLVASGVKSYLFSFHSHRPAVYDKITGSRGQFPRAVAGLTRLLRDARCDVTVNIVVNAANAADLPGTIAFLAGLRARGGRARKPSVYLSMINEAGHQKAPSWAVDLARAAPFLRQADEACRRAGFAVARSAGESSFPPCVFAAPGRHASQRPLPQERVRYAEDFSGEAGLVGRAKRPSCRGCAYDARCTGVSAQYAGLFGLAALKPVGVSGRRS